MTLGLRCSEPARRPHPASLPVRVPSVESLPSASFSFRLTAGPCGSATVAVIGSDWLLSSNEILPMLGTLRVRPPGRTLALTFSSKVCFMVAALVSLTITATAQPKRARDLGVPLEGTPGPLNAITDIAGIEVGHTTLIEGASVRTGVTVIWPRGKQSDDPAFGGWFSLNGNGEMTGTTWLEESGFLDGPILITNTHSVGTVRDAYIAWQVEHKRKPGTNSFGGGFWSLPIVAETYDGFLNDTNGFHVKPQHVAQALDSAARGRVPEGNVGGGTGMICFGFKGGIGTSSRIAGQYRVAALVQCNCGSKRQLRIAERRLVRISQISPWHPLARSRWKIGDPSSS